jgi:hypothetical protein
MLYPTLLSPINACTIVVNSAVSYSATLTPQLVDDINVWAPKHLGDFMQLDLLQTFFLHGILIRGGSYQWTTSLEVWTRTTPCDSNGSWNQEVIDGNTDATTPIYAFLSKTVLARCIRLIPKETTQQVGNVRMWPHMRAVPFVSMDPPPLTVSWTFNGTHTFYVVEKVASDEKHELCGTFGTGEFREGQLLDSEKSFIEQVVANVSLALGYCVHISERYDWVNSELASVSYTSPKDCDLLLCID